jgi:hypothetical protein
MTKMKRIVFKFSKPLTEKLQYQGLDVIQEEILYADVNGIREKIAKELKKVLKSVGVIRFINPDLFTALEYRVNGLNYSLENMVDFRRIDDLTYHFIYPMDLAALLTIKKVGLKLGLLKIKDRDLELVKVIREQEIISAFEKFSFKEMKLQPGDWVITAEEFETDAPEPQESILSSKEVASEPERANQNEAKDPAKDAA